MKKIKTIEKNILSKIEVSQKLEKEKLEIYNSNQYSTTDSIVKNSQNKFKIEKSFFKSQNEKIKNYINFSKSAIKMEKDISELSKKINESYEETLGNSIVRENKRILKKNRNII